MREQSRLAAELREDIARVRGDNARLLEENARLRARDAERDAELEKLRADFTVLQRILFGRSSEKKPAGPPPAGGDGAGEPGSGKKGVKRGPGARAGRRDYSHLPRVEVIWDFEGGGYCCPECGTPITRLGRGHVTGLLDLQRARGPR